MKYALFPCICYIIDTIYQYSELLDDMFIFCSHHGFVLGIATLQPQRSYCTSAPFLHYVCTDVSRRRSHSTLHALHFTLHTSRVLLST